MKKFKLLASFLTVATLLQTFIMFPQTAKASTYPTQQGNTSYNYNLKTGDNLLAPWNSVFTDGNVGTSYLNGMTGKFTWDNFHSVNEINGKDYTESFDQRWISGGNCGYLQGGALFRKGQQRIPLADLGINSSTTDTTFSFWLNWDGTNSFIPIGFTSLSLYIRDGQFGINTGSGDIYGIDSPFKIGQYTHVTVRFHINNVTKCEMYVNGIKQTMTQKGHLTDSSKINFNGGIFCIDGWTNNINYRSENSWIDELYVWNRALSEQEVNDMYHSFDHTNSYLKDAKMRMTFDNAEVGNEITEKFYNSASNSYAYGSNAKKRAALKLDGDRIQIPLSDLGFTSEDNTITISFWYKSDPSKYKLPIGVFDSYSGKGFNLYESEDSEGNPIVGYNAGHGETYGPSGYPFSISSWNHVVLTVKSGKPISSATMHINGTRRNLKQIKGTAVSDDRVINSSCTLYINAPRDVSYDYSCQGTSYIDEVMVWNRELTGNEIKSVYQSNAYSGTGNNVNNGYWETFSYDAGGSTGLTIKNDATLGMNYMHLNSNDKNTLVDTGAILKVENLKPNTWYTASGYVRASPGTNWGKGLFYIVNSSNASSRYLNASSIDTRVNITNTWIRNSVTFNTGDNNNSIYWRINRGDHTFVDATALKLEEGRYATPFIGYNDTKTYAYGFMDNLISPHDSYLLTDKNALPSQTTPENNWKSFYYDGDVSSCTLQQLGYNNNNYYHMFAMGGKGFGNSGAMLKIPNVEPNTDYTVGVWMKIPNKSLNNGKGRLLVTGEDDNIVASINPKDSKGNDTTNTNGTWKLVQGSFNTGNNASIKIKINRGDSSFIDFTLLTLQGGKNPIPLTNGAYSGTVSPYKVTFTPDGGKVNHHDPVGVISGRKVSLSDYYTDDTWHTSPGQMRAPSTLRKSYYDAATGQTFNFNLNKSGGVYTFTSGSKSYTTTEYEKVNDWYYSSSNGDRFHYDPYGHTTLGYMSNNTSYYYGGAYSYWNKPRPPVDYYGPDYGSDPYGWKLVNRYWAENFVVDAFQFRGGGNYWVSDARSGSHKNRYRKGVFLEYKKWKTYSKPVTVTKHYSVWKYKQNYSGTFNLPDIVNHYNDYSTTTNWNVKVDYKGALNPRNLKALSVGIYTEDGVETTSIQAGQTYVAKIKYTNDGDVDVDSPFNVALYDEKGNKINATQVECAKTGVTSTLNLTFTGVIPGKHIFKAIIDDDNKIVEVNENDNEVSTDVINVFVINIKTTALSIVGLNDDKVQTSLQIGKQYRAKIKVKNNGGQDVDTFNIGLYGVQSPPPEDAYAFPDTTTQLGSDYVVKGGLKKGEELGVILGKDYAYITFTANSTDVHGFTAWADNRDVIKESNEYDNVKSLALNTLAYNVKANSLEFVDIATGVTTTTLYKNRQYKAVYSISNDKNTDLVPVQVGLYDGVIGSSKEFQNASNYQLFSGQTISNGEQYFTPQDIGINKNYYIKADNDDSYDETNESDNYQFKTVNVYNKNITATSIKVVDSSNKAVTSLIQGYSYKANITISNSGTIDINEAFNVGLEVNGILQTSKVACTGVFAKGTTKTATISFTATNTGTYKLVGVADCDNQVWESDETDNKVSSSLTSYYVNLRADSIDIVGLTDTTPATTLQLGKQYRAMIKFTNTGQVTARNFQVALTQNTVTIGTPATVSSLEPNTQATVYITFTADSRGNLAFEGFVDSTNVIKETNENDNKVQTVKTGVKVNLVAVSVDIVGTGDTVSKNPLTQKLPYRAMINIKNDGDTNVGPFTVRLDECTSPSGAATVAGTVNVDSLKAGATTTLYVNISPKNRGLRRFTAVVDSKNVIDETNEADNTTYVDKTVNRVNVKAVAIDVQDSEGVSQTVLQKDLNYNAKVKLINDGDVNLGAFNLGLYDNGVRIASLPIASLNTGTTSTTFTIPFTPQNTGSRTLMAFADDNLQITESDETDNKVQCVVSVNDLMLVNYRIVSMVNPPSKYTYPLDISKMPVGVKSGYNVTFNIDVIGVADTVIAEFSDNSMLNNKTVSFTKIKDIDATHSTWEVVVNTDLDTPINTIINSVVKGTKGTFVYNYNTANSWNGQTLKIVGSALEDFIINRTH